MLLSAIPSTLFGHVWHAVGEEVGTFVGLEVVGGVVGVWVGVEVVGACVGPDVVGETVGVTVGGHVMALQQLVLQPAAMLGMIWQKRKTPLQSGMRSG